jgi:hypothetical protein
MNASAAVKKELTLINVTSHPLRNKLVNQKDNNN